MTEKYYSLSNKDVFEHFKASKKGLAKEEAKKRITRYGPNTIPHKEGNPWYLIILFQFKSPLVYILLAAGIVSLALQEFIDFGIIIAAILVNVIIGFVQENKAQNALAKLSEVISYKAHVIREGHEMNIDSKDLVPGDIIILDTGNKVSADARLFETNDLEVDEASLTGESVSENKQIEKNKDNTHLGDRTCMLFSGTTVVKGRAKAIVVATGIKTEIGKIADLIKNTKDEETPLQKKLNKFSRTLAILVVIVSVAIFIVGLLKGIGFESIFITAVAVAVAAIPEGLVIATTVILAIGMQKILKKKALVRNLVSAETLGSATVICTDKTGTLTKGEMQVSEIVTYNNNLNIENKLNKHTDEASDESLMAVQIGMMCNDAFVENPDEELASWKISGNITEKALLLAGIHLGFKKDELLKDQPKIDTIPFDSQNKYMVTLHKLSDKKNIMYLKGAPERIVAMSKQIRIGDREEVFDEARKTKFAHSFEELSKKGLRLLALGYQTVGHDFDKFGDEFKYKQDSFVFVGFVAIKDPLREEVQSTIATAKRAGIKTVIITGDHKLTAMAIAEEAGLQVKAENVLEGDDMDKLNDADLLEKVANIKLYARVSPEHKIRIVDAWQKKGEVVAMTGDGVNDSPALKKADIGIAVGSGTDVAKEIADMVILDDNFTTIVDAIREGRGIFDNIKKSITYILSDSFTEVVLIGGALLFGLPLPLTAAMILYINLFEDSFPDMALAFESVDPDVMLEKAKGHKANLFDNEVKTLIFIIGIVTDLVLFGLFWFVLRVTNDLSYAQTLVFVTLGVDSFFFVFSCKNLKKSILHINPFDNKWLLGSIALGFGFLLAALYVPFMQRILNTHPLDAWEWIVVIGFGLFNILLIEIAKYFFIHKKHHKKKTHARH